MGWDQIESKWLAMTRRVRAGDAASEVTQRASVNNLRGGDIAVTLPLVTALPVSTVSDQAEPQQ